MESGLRQKYMTSNGTSPGVIKYYPYGDCRNSTGDSGTDKLFTGQRLDDTGLYYYGARYYDPTIGRFISPDSFVAILGGYPIASAPLTVKLSSVNARTLPLPLPPQTSQTLNRYSYVINNPLRYVDTNGEIAWLAIAAAAIYIANFVAVITFFLEALKPILHPSPAPEPTPTPPPPTPQPPKPAYPEWRTREPKNPEWRAREEPKLPLEKTDSSTSPSRDTFIATVEQLDQLEYGVGTPEYQQKIDEAFNEIAAGLGEGQVVGWSSEEGYHAVDISSYDYEDLW